MANKMEKLKKCPLCFHGWPLRRLPNNKYYCTVCEVEFRVKRRPKEKTIFIIILDILEDGEAQIRNEIPFPHIK